MAEIIIDETLYLIFILFSIFSSIAIIVLLAVQSFVLVKLMPLIRTTAQNSSMFTNALSPIKKMIGFDTKEYPRELTKQGLLHCPKPFEISHVHNSDCV